MGRTPLKTAHRRIPAERVRFRASPSCFRPPPLVPGLFWFRARVILLTDGPTRPIQRLPVRERSPHSRTLNRLFSLNLGNKIPSGAEIGNGAPEVPTD